MRTWVDLTVPAGKVASTQTDFVTRVDLHDLPAGWWAQAPSDGADVRVKSSGTVVPTDLAKWAPALRVGELWFRSTLTTGSNAFTVECGTGAAALAVGDPNGRNAVWADFDFMISAKAGIVDRTGKGTVTVVGTPFSDWLLDKRYSPPSMPTVSNEGIAQDSSGNWYIISLDSIRKYDSTFTTLLATKTGCAAAASITGANHLGDGQVVGGELYVPCEKYTNSPYNNQWITVWDLSTLAFVRKYDISANLHEISGIAWNPDDSTWYATDFTTPGNGILHKYDASWNHTGTVTQTGVTSATFKQALTYLGSGKFLVFTNQEVYTITTAGVTVKVGEFTFGAGSKEGIQIGLDGNLYSPEETAARVNMWIPNVDGMLSAGGDGGSTYVTIGGLPKRTAWTMGAVARGAMVSGSNAAIMSYSDNSTTDANRASIVRRASANNWCIWNSSDGFQVSTGAAPVANGDGVRYMWDHTQNTTTDRKIWRDGAIGGTDTGAAQRPASTGDTVFLLVEDLSHTEAWLGGVDFPYLRNGVQSADWIAAKKASWESPSTFYTIGSTIYFELPTVHEVDTARPFAIPYVLGGTVHETDHVYPLTYITSLATPRETDTAYALGIEEIPYSWTAALRVGEHSFTIERGDTVDEDDPIQVLDALNIGWDVDESAAWPAQPNPAYGNVRFYTADVDNLEDVALGTTMSIVLTDSDGHVFGTFHGRVAQLSATPVKRGNNLFMIYTIRGVGYPVDLAELPVTIGEDWPAESADDRFARIAAAILAAGGPVVEPPADTGSAAFEAYDAGTTTAGELIASHLAQVAISSDYGPVRYLLVPVIVADELDRFVCIVVPRDVDAALLPGTLEVVDGLLTLTFPDPYADGMVDACDVDLDTTWNRLKYRAVNRVTVTGETVSAEIVREGPPVRLDLGTTLTDAFAARRMARLYFPDLDESNGWVPDTLQLEAWRHPQTITPSWFPDHRDDPADNGVYVMPLVVWGIPEAMNLAGVFVYSGQLTSVSLTMQNRNVYVAFALRRQLPVGTGTDAASWAWAQSEFPTVAIEDVDPDLSFYEARLARSF